MTSRRWPTPRRGSIVLCKFPLNEAPTVPGPYARPAIVVDISSTGDKVQVCYGTGQAHHASVMTLSDVQFGVFEEKHLNALSLHEATIFDLSRAVTLPYDEIWFEVPKGMQAQNPVIGSLDQCKALKNTLFRAMYMAGMSTLLPPQVCQQITDELALDDAKKTGT